MGTDNSGANGPHVPNRDWLIFGLSCAVFGLAGLSAVLGVLLTRKYTPRVITKEVVKEVEKVVPTPIQVQDEPDVECTEKCLFERLNMLVPPVRIQAVKIDGPDRYRTFDLDDVPVRIVLLEDGDGLLETIKLSANTEAFSEASLIQVEDRTYQLRRILDVIGYISSEGKGSNGSQPAYLFSRHCRNQPAVHVTDVGAFNGYVDVDKGASPQRAELTLIRKREP